MTATVCDVGCLMLDIMMGYTRFDGWLPCVTDVRLLAGHVELGLHVRQHDLQERTLLPWT